MKKLSDVLKTSTVREGIKTDICNLICDLDLNYIIDQFIMENKNNCQAIVNIADNSYEFTCSWYFDEKEEKYLFESRLYDMVKNYDAAAFLAVFDKNLNRIQEDTEECIWSLGCWKNMDHLKQEKELILFKCGNCDLLTSEEFYSCPKCGYEKNKVKVNIKYPSKRECNFERKGYGIFVADGSSFYIPNAKHIEKIDEDNVFNSDEEAAKQAEKDGIKLIHNMKYVPNGVYLNTKENIEIITKALSIYPEYKKWGEGKANKIEIGDIYFVKTDNVSNVVDFQFTVKTDYDNSNQEHIFITCLISENDIDNPKSINLWSHEEGEIIYTFTKIDLDIIKKKIRSYIFKRGWESL